MTVRNKNKSNNLERYAKKQMGYLGTKLIVSSKLVPTIVHHINSGDSGLARAKPIIPAGAPLASFIYEDVISRAEETIQRYLCGEDELLKTKSQMTQLIVHHLETYHGLLKAVAKESKLALDKKRTRKVPEGTDIISISSVKNKREAIRELARKEKELDDAIKKSANKNERNKIQRTIAQLKSRKSELEGNEALKKYEDSRVLSKSDIPESTQALIYASKGRRTKNENIALEETDVRCVPPTVNLKKQSSQNASLYEEKMSHLVFSSLMIPTEQLKCEDTRVTSFHESEFQKWSKENPVRSPGSDYESIRSSVLGVTNVASSRIPFKTIYGDRLVKRRLVLHSFVQRLDSLLYTGFSGSRFQLHPLKARFEELFLYDNKGSKNGPGAINQDTSGLIWNQALRSFGSAGPQTYWIQLLREMYDARRVENIRKKTRLLNARNNKAMSPSDIQNTFKNLNLPDNLGVTSYGYTCDPSDTTKPWRKSYHRFGRAWFCNDTNADPYQLPFGAYNDACAPPVKHLSNPNYNANSGMEPSGIKDSLMTIAVNNICTNVLQSQARLGTQGRYAHIKTAYNGKSIGKMTPSEALRVFMAVRTSSGPDQKQTTQPFFLDGAIIKQGHDLRLSILEARKALKPLGDPTEVSTFTENLENNANNANVITTGNNKMTRMNNSPNNKNNLKNIKNVLFTENKKSINLNALRTNTNRSSVLREFLVGTSQWPQNQPGPAKVTGYNLDVSKLHKIGAGLHRSMQDRQNDAETLNRNFLMVDGEIYTECEKSKKILMYGGSAAALGIAKKFQEQKGIAPLILPVDTSSPEYKQVKQNATKSFKLLVDDSDKGIKGLVERQMANVCIPMLEGGSLTKGAHYNDLMNRFLQITKSTEMKGESLEAKLKTPALYNIVKCLQFYLYVHVGLSTQEALNEIQRYQVRRNARQSQRDMYSLATKLRMLGDAGPMPPSMFKKIVRQYFLTSASKFEYKEGNEVKQEILKIRRGIKSFRLFGKDIRRPPIPSFLGGKPKASANMGVPNSGNVNVRKIRSVSRNKQNKVKLIGNTKVRMTAQNARRETARQMGSKVPAARAQAANATRKTANTLKRGYSLTSDFLDAARQDTQTARRKNT